MTLEKALNLLRSRVVKVPISKCREECYPEKATQQGSYDSQPANVQQACLDCKLWKGKCVAVIEPRSNNTIRIIGTCGMSTEMPVFHPYTQEWG